MGMNDKVFKKKRQSRYKPNPHRDTGTRITARDIKLFETVLKEQFLTCDQLRRLFNVSQSTMTIRLRKLWNQGYLGKAFAPVSFGSSPAIYYPTTKCINNIIERTSRSREDISWTRGKSRLSPEKKQHELDLNEFNVSLMSALRLRYGEEALASYWYEKETEGGSPEVELLFCEKGTDYWDYVRDPSPEPGEPRRIPIRSDRFMGLRIDGKPQYCFIEIDRGTMPLKRIRRKLRGYHAYYLSGGFLKKYGQPGDRIEDYPFRVLVTAITEERRNNLVEEAIAVRSLEMMWFSVFSEFINDPLGKVWVRGVEYQEIMRQMPKETQGRLVGAYRKVERDKIVEARIGKYSILD
jgi:hypothetical protein